MKREKGEKELERYLNQLCSLAKEIAPEAEVYVSRKSYEEEDAWIDIIAPESRIDELMDKLYPVRSDIFYEHGYHIAVSIREKDSAEVNQKK